MVLLAGHHRSDSRPLLSALPEEGEGGGASLAQEKNGSGSHPLHRRRSGYRGGLNLGLRHQRADTDPRLHRRRRRRRLRRRPLPPPAAINGKMAAAALARIRAVGLRSRRLAPKVPRQLSFATNYLGSHSASRCIKLVERPRKRFSETDSRLSISGLPLPAGKGPGLRSSMPFRAPRTLRPPGRDSTLKPHLWPYYQHCSPSPLEELLNSSLFTDLRSLPGRESITDCLPASALRHGPSQKGLRFLSPFPYPPEGPARGTSSLVSCLGRGQVHSSRKRYHFPSSPPPSERHSAGPFRGTSFSDRFRSGAEIASESGAAVWT